MVNKISFSHIEHCATSTEDFIMVRSEEAIKRRASKRQRTEEEQRIAERRDLNKAKNRRTQRESTTEAAAFTENDPMKEAGAWTCPGCGNNNFASRNWCNSKTCNEARPGGPIAREPRRSYQNTESNPMDEEGAWTCPRCETRNFASRSTCFSRSCQQKRPEGVGTPSSYSNRAAVKSNPRHDPLTSKNLNWKKQADKSTVMKNQDLRQQYKETNGEGMSEADIERAKILIARDERKVQKKENLKKRSRDEDEPIQPTTSPAPVSPKKVSSKSQRDQNKALMAKYESTKGDGMTPEQVERAKILIERRERKQKRRESAPVEAE
eukprot:Nitzschia sp. Nitz4//scaffold67_size101165//59310//60278//NITZ4_004531-RA/size101165-processed-gene-0.42-mRNA-1//1//CDS//3329556480//7120//frame0